MSSRKCCFTCACNDPRSTGARFWFKPCRVLLSTFCNWWIPRICLLFCIIFYFIVAFGFKIGVHLSVYDLNENITSREVMWHLVNVCWMFMVGFYCWEWCKDGSEQTTYSLEEYGAPNSEGVVNLSARDDGEGNTKRPESD